MTTGSASVADDGILSSLRYLFADLLGEDDDTPPVLPEGLPETVAPIASEAINRLIAYQSLGYARLYIDRLRRFVGRHNVDAALLADIAVLMAERMSYQDPIRIAQLKLAELDEPANAPAVEVRKFRLDELLGSLPAAVGEPVLEMLEWMGWAARRRIPIRFSIASRLGIRRLKIEAALRRWRLFSVRYTTERAWVERWLHMIDRSLTKQPPAASAIVQTATMIQGYGDAYRHGVADWHAIIDGLAKPTFDGALDLPNLAAAIVEARAAIMPDPRQASLKRKIAEIRARASAADNLAR